MKIAVDNQISLIVVDKLKRDHQVVLWAGNQQDEEWIEDALDRGAEVFVSPDLDVPNYLDKIDSDAIWIDIPQGLPKGKQFDFITKALKGIGK